MYSWCRHALATGCSFELFLPVPHPELLGVALVASSTSAMPTVQDGADELVGGVPCLCAGRLNKKLNRPRNSRTHCLLTHHDPSSSSSSFSFSSSTWPGLNPGDLQGSPGQRPLEVSASAPLSPAPNQHQSLWRLHCHHLCSFPSWLFLAARIL